jgi:hypothetical protein
MRGFVLAIFCICSTLAFAVPKENVLVSPTQVTLGTHGMLHVDVVLPCASADTASLVLTSDDTGDRKVAVGVVYSASARECKAQAPKDFALGFNIENSGYYVDPSDPLDFEPMDIKAP